MIGCDLLQLVEQMVDASRIVAEFLVSSEVDLSQLIEVDLSDVIASLPEEDGLFVLKTFSEALASCSSPRSLLLSDNALGCKGLEMCSSLIQKSSLKQLELCNNGLSEASMHTLASLLSNSNTSLEIFKIANNMSGRGGCQAMANILRSSSDDLKEIMFSGTRADKVGSLMVAQAICDKQPMGPLEKLHLADNFFSGEAAMLLAASLKTCSSLTWLNLRDCCLTNDDDDGSHEGSSAIQALTDALIESGCPLEFLDLSGNEINYSQGLSDLVSSKRSSLKMLRLEENELKSKGVRALVKTLVDADCKLKELLLGSNQCATRGAQALLDASSSLLPTLEILGLDGNSIPDSLLDKLTETYGPVLQEINENNSDEEDEETDDEIDGDDVQDDDDDEINQLAKAQRGIQTFNFIDVKPFFF